MLRRAGKPATIFVAVGALAAGAGISAAKVWHAMHMSLTATATVAPTASSSPKATLAQAVPDSDRPINAAPPRPLTGADFGGLNPVAPSALANVDTRALIAPRTPSQPHQVSSVTPSATDESRVAASPILIHRVATTTQQPTRPAPAIASVQADASAVVPNTPQPERASQSNTERSAASTTPQSVATADAPSAKPVVRPIHHMSAHRSHESGETAGATGTPAPSTAPAPAATKPAGKSGDVQLF